MSTPILPFAPTGSDGGADDAAAGGSTSLPGLPADVFEPDMGWVRIRLEDANRAFSHGCYEDMRDALALANGMMRYLAMLPDEAAS